MEQLKQSDLWQPWANGQRQPWAILFFLNYILISGFNGTKFCNNEEIEALHDLQKEILD